MMLRVLLGLLALFACATAAHADDNRPLTVSLEEAGNGTVRATWKVPANVGPQHVPSLSAEPLCGATGAQRNWSDPMGHWREETWRCSRGLPGHEIRIAYPFANPNLATIVRFHPAVAGDPQTVLLQPHETRFTLAAVGEEQGSFGDFLVLGIEHIAIGFDHLLFVAALIFIAGTLRRVLATITGFTIAHSITLALAALDIVRLPIAAIEAVIALSIVFLAVEIVKGPRDTLTWRKPIVVASAFGLLHGFGFAAVLQEIGLPNEGVVTALLAFNMGIEIGQIAFAAIVLTLLRGAAWASQRIGRSLPLPPLAGYAVGSLASFWMLERMAG